MRFLGFLGLFFLIRIFEIAFFPAVASFYIPFSLWYGVLLFALVPVHEVVVAMAGIALIESFFHVSDTFLFVLLVFFAACAAVALRLVFSREGAIGNIFALIGGLFVFRIVGPVVWIVGTSSARGGILFFTEWLGMIAWSDLVADMLFVSLAAYVLVRRERGRRITARAYV